MKILMTGGTGFIGQKLGQTLASQGHELIILSRQGEAAQHNILFPAKLYKWDGETEVAPKDCFKDVDAIIHLAGESLAEGRWSKKRKQKLKDSRILSTQNLLEGLKKSGRKPQILISGSAIGYYGYSRGNKDEFSKPGDDFVAELCKEWESAAETIKKFSPSTRLIKLRTGVVLGQGGGFFGKLVPLFKQGLGAVLGSGKQWISWIQIQDLNRLIIEILKNEKIEGAINATAPHPITNRDLTLALAQHLKVRLLPAVPPFVLKLAYGELSELLLEGAAVTSKKLKDLGFKFQSRTFSEALKNTFS